MKTGPFVFFRFKPYITPIELVKPLQIDNPIPRPGALNFFSLSILANREKIFSCSRAGMPRPVSFT
jgi:hypothetical protein